MAQHPTNSVVLEMSGRVYASILQRASSYILTLPFTAPFQVCILFDVLFFCFFILIGDHILMLSSLFFFLFKQYTHLVAIPSSRAQPAHHCHFSSWGTSRSGQLCFRGEESGVRSQSGRHLSTHQDLDFQLSQVQINSILRSNEQVIDMKVSIF